jgi:hypothetical protein
MALRLRRGTDAERGTITPLSGELIYTTDTKKLYAGDGTTVGGVLVGPPAASSFDLVNDTTPQLGGNLDLNGSNITGTGNINITGTITATGSINLGDGAEDNVFVGGLISSSLIPNQDAAYDLGTSVVRWRNGFFEGLSVDGEISAFRINSTLLGNDSTIAYDPATGVFEGTSFLGSVTGDVTGSVFGQDSTPLIDAISNTVIAPFIDTDNLAANLVRVEDETDPQVNIARISTGDLSAYAGRIGDIQFRTAGSDGTKTYGIVTSFTSGVIIAHNDNGVDFPADTLNTITKTGVALGGINPQARLDVRGDAIVSGTIDAASFKGSLVADDSTILIDAINGSLVTANIDIVGSTGTPSVGAGDLANVNEWLQVTVNGNTRYIPLYA